MSNDPELLEPIDENLPPTPSADAAEDMEEIDLDPASQPVYYEKDIDPVLNPRAAFHEHNIDAPKSPALTIHIASWATPIIGLLMLVVGLAGGFFLRPVLLPVQTAVTPTAGTASNPAAEQAQPSQQQPSANDREALMEAIVPQVRHFKGNPEAPITLIEFSDFQ